MLMATGLIKRNINILCIKSPVFFYIYIEITVFLISIVNSFLTNMILLRNLRGENICRTRRHCPHSRNLDSNLKYTKKLCNKFESYHNK